MKVVLVERGKWPRALPHFDVRICPECGALVSGKAGQDLHQGWHEECDANADEWCKRTGMAEEQVELPTTYRAEVMTGMGEISDEEES